VARAVRRYSRDIVLYGLAGSAMLVAGVDAGLAVAAEAFPDRAYEPDGRLRSRNLPDSVLTDSAAIGRRAVAMATAGTVEAIDGAELSIEAGTLCLHGDTPGAADHATAVRAALAAAGVDVGAIGGA
jgi:UPF0271 protein